MWIWEPADLVSVRMCAGVPKWMAIGPGYQQALLLPQVSYLFCRGIHLSLLSNVVISSV